MSMNNFEREVYETMVETEMEHKPNFLDCEKSSDYLILSNDEKIAAEETMIEEKIEIEEDIDINDLHRAVRNVKNETQEDPVYFEEVLETCEEVTVDYNDSSMSIPLSPPISPTSPHARFKIKREWPQANNEEKLHSMHLDHEIEKEYYAEEEEGEIGDNNDEDEEETIATFVTAAGQQLALYAVEDSEDVFAVAVYDESGEPPTNFQFLMKSDVERLIGEGAVRTVKKPSQIKKQLLTTQPPVFQSKQRSAPCIQNNHGLASEVKSRRDKVAEQVWSNNAVIDESCHAILDANATAKENHSHKQSNNVATYLMMNDTAMDIVGPAEGNQEPFGSESEIVEQSTVQYILLDGDQSDSELTFDEIQATLQGLKFPTNKAMKKKLENHKNTTDEENSANHNENDITAAEKSEAVQVNDEIENCANTFHQDISKEAEEIESRLGKKSLDAEEKDPDKVIQRDLAELRPNVGEKQADKSSKDVSVASGDERIKTNGIEEKENSIDTLRGNATINTEIRPKIKRPRKQQLTSVNRGDSEIIIQPASIGAEEDSNNKKRGRRKKKPVPDPDYNPRPVRSKKIKKSPKNSKVEIIEIDVDEEQSILNNRKEVIEITIDDGKEKGSSDKENEIIMLGDSDDESEDKIPVKTLPPAMQCKHCSRNFRQKRALDTHARVCPKLKNNIEQVKAKKVESRSGSSSSKKESDNKQSANKEYTCKVCNEKFTAVVALARHARTEHQKKYKNKGGSKSIPEVKSTETEIVKPKNSSVDKKADRVDQKKKIQSSNKLWKSKKLNCNDCGRWFPSTAILAAHCLQHATKNSEKQIRRCKVCKKLIKTRSLYIQHMKTHGRVTRNTKISSMTVLQKKLRQTRQVASKITSVKKRGRPRKL